ncbi:MAG: YbhB/YbcL family Raf kinase inhibitor-like protein [Flavobacteriales bacterium]|nr:YbhB/YbcL family Raf kinase inhibitor-like protein [Flavobacteriales bacterium]
MKKIFFGFVLLASVSLYSQNTFTLMSNDLGGQATNNQIYNGFGCTGNNISPDLHWINPPEGTQSYAITMYDPDAPTGSGWWHWIVFNIPSTVSQIPSDAGKIENQLMPKEAIQSITDYGTYGFGGACPPKGDGFHRYIITIHALKVSEFDFNKDVNPALVGYYINSNTIGKASLIFYHKR